MALDILIAELNRKLDDEKETLHRRYQDYGHAVFHEFGEFSETQAKSEIEAQLKVVQSIENALKEVQRIALTVKI